MKNPVTLIFALASKSMYRPTLYSTREILCSPDEIVRVVDGRPITLQTPVGEFDVKSLLERLPSDCQPELVVVKMDATGRTIPRGLSSLKCPKVLVIGAPHQFDRPLTNLLHYLEREKFDVIVSDHDRHHLHWFARAGWPRVAWIPGLNFNLRERPIAEPSMHGALFVGQTGKFHPYRSEVFRSLARRGLPVTIRTSSPDEAADLYSRAVISLNGSLNGDLNLRVFEILGSGGFLMTDRLSSDSGLERLFRDGEDLVLYEGADDLAEKVRYYLEHPSEAMAIRRCGHERLIEYHSPELKRQQLLDLVFEGKVDPMYALEDDRYRMLVALPNPILYDDVGVYEFLQQRHISAYRLIVYAKTGCRLSFAEDLPRLVYRSIEQAGEDVSESLPATLREDRFLLLDGSGDVTEWSAQIDAFIGRFVIVRGRSDGVLEVLAPYGFAEVEGRPGLFEQSFPLLAAVRAAGVGAIGIAGAFLAEVGVETLDTESQGAYVEVAKACGDLARCRDGLLRLLQSRRSEATNYVELSQVLAAMGDEASALIHLYEARRLGAVFAQEDIDLLIRLEGAPASTSPAVARFRERVVLGSRPARLGGPARILVYTNLFPPQELGGYGRKMWEFAYELYLRGHDVRVLTGDAPYLWKDAQGEEMALEGRVDRCLKLFGQWSNGSVSMIDDRREVSRMALDNAATVVSFVDEFAPDFCLMGNLDLIGHLAIEQLTTRGVPVVQCMGNEFTGWPVDFTPDWSRYVAGPASRFLAGKLERQGFRLTRAEVLYPGARIDRFYRHVMPCRDIPRIAFAGLLMRYKGAHTLIEALRLLHAGGVAFEAVIAGDSTDRQYVDTLKNKVMEAGMGDRVSFPGFLDRAELNRLFCRSNILAFPSVFEEPFGISQVEGLASGLVVITSGRGGSPEIVRDGVDGVVFKVEDAVDLARRIAELVANPGRWEELALAGRERAMEFSIPATVDKIEELFSSMRSVV